MKFFIPYDGSRHSNEAIRYALPYLAGGEAHVYIAGSSSEVERSAALGEDARAIIAGAAQRISVDTEVVPMKATAVGAAIATRAAEVEADLIVMGTYAVALEHLLGTCVKCCQESPFPTEKQTKVNSVAGNVLARSKGIPVLIVHEGATESRNANGHSAVFPTDCREDLLQSVERSARLLDTGTHAFVFHAGAGVLPQELETDSKDCVQAAAGIPRENVHLVLPANANPLVELLLLQKTNNLDLIVVGTYHHLHHGDDVDGEDWLHDGSLPWHLLQNPGPFAMLVTFSEHPQDIDAAGRADLVEGVGHDLNLADRIAQLERHVGLVGKLESGSELSLIERVSRLEATTGIGR